MLQLALWVAARRGEWLVPRFLLTPTALLAVISAIGVDLLARGRPPIRWAVTAMVVFLVLTLKVSGTTDTSGRTGALTSAARPGAVAGAPGSVSRLSGPPRRGARLDADHRLMIEASLYNLPEERLPFASTEREVSSSSLSPRNASGST